MVHRQTLILPDGTYIRRILMYYRLYEVAVLVNIHHQPM